MEPNRQNTTRSNAFSVAFLSLVLCLIAVIVWRAQDITDWWVLRNYQPSSTVRSLADAASMNDEGRKLFYVNKPQIISGQAFSSQCDFGAEKTIVLGCYIAEDGGIYLYDVTDPRLDGVEQTTAAHEMLHAAYRRLSSSEKKRIDDMLLVYYASLKDERLLATIDSYKKTEPSELTNEMHSIFATEIANLTPDLEEYYRTYFDDRMAVVRLSEKYQHEFTSRREQAAAYDEELSVLKSEIDRSESTLKSMENELSARYKRLQSLRTSGDAAYYNSQVDDYNYAVEQYNTILNAVKSQISTYNEIVRKRNALALEDRELTEALSNKPL